jgi:multidrug efflux pump subunit AcrA (membrane-fusion protein)
VNVKLAARTLKGATVIPQVAVIRGPRGTIVYTVDASNKATARPIELVYSAGLDAVITGIDAGERVVLDGRQNLRTGAPVIERAASGMRGNSAVASAPQASPGASASGISP